MNQKKFSTKNTKGNKNFMNNTLSDSSEEKVNEVDFIYDRILEYNPVSKLKNNNDNIYSKEIFKNDKKFINHIKLF